jgi:hypothetical protein
MGGNPSALSYYTYSPFFFGDQLIGWTLPYVCQTCLIYDLILASSSTPNRLLQSGRISANNQAQYGRMSLVTFAASCLRA